jgi:hypothetical protein
MGPHAGRRAQDPLAQRTRLPSIHLSIGIAQLSVECDRITVITDPADALDQIAANAVAALRARQLPGTGDRRPATGSQAAPRPAAVKLLHSVAATAPGSGSSWTSTRSTHLTH